MSASRPPLISERLFRRAALDRLSTPEDLDRLVTVAISHGRAARAVVGSLLAALAFGIILLALA